MISWFINSYERLPPDVPSMAVRLSNRFIGVRTHGSVARQVSIPYGQSKVCRRGATSLYDSNRITNVAGLVHHRRNVS
jgi:hypothetical protein